MSANPSLLALWLVDEVTLDERTNRLTLRGLFNQIALPPGVVEYTNPFTVFFSVTGVRFRCPCELKMSDLSNLEVIYSRPVILDPVGPFEVTDMQVRVNQIPMPHPGEYVWELFYGNELLGGTRLRVTELTDDGNGEVEQ